MRSRQGNTTPRCRSRSSWRGCSPCRSRRFSTMVTREVRMSRDDAKPYNVAALILWPIAITLIAAGLLGGFAGYNQAALDNGGTPLPGWAGPLAALGFAALALAAYVRRYRSAWRGLSPQIGRAHVCTPVTNAHLVFRLLLDKKN